MADVNLPQTTFAPNSHQLSGLKIIPAVACAYPPTIDRNDLVLVDFDRRAVEYGSLYLVEEVVDGKVTWMGCRRLDRLPGKTRIDVSGSGEWRDFQDIGNGWRIAGEVIKVYKPS